MDTVDVSPQYKATSPFVPSPTASHVACLSGARFQIRSLSTFELIRSIALPSSHDVRNSRIAWSPLCMLPSGDATPPNRASSTTPHSYRILVADDNTTRIYDLRDEKWTATINNGSGGMGKNVHVDFGRDENEVLVWSDFGSRVMVWCLRTGRSVEIRDPKYSGKDNRGWDYRPCIEAQSTGGRGTVLALLCRSAGMDMLVLLAPSTYKVLKRVELATQDAQGLRWSGDGRWLAVWDAASVGYSLCIYTADGHLYRKMSREPSDEMNDWGIEGLGIKTVEWIPGNERLAVGGWDRRVRILSTRTFSPIVYLDHTAEICVTSASVYTEQLDARGSRSFTHTPQPAVPPKASVERNSSGLMKRGISTLAFNKDGTLCATRDDSTPTTVWIWDLCSLQPRTILIMHSPVKSLQWHPTHPSHLLIETSQDSPTFYLHSTQALAKSTSSASTPDPGPPTILSVSENMARPIGTTMPKWTARWLRTEADKKMALIAGHQQGYVLVWPDGKDQILRFEGQEGDESDDSLYDILTGRTPVPPLRRTGRDIRGSDGSAGSRDDDFVEEVVAQMEAVSGHDSTVGLEDTFRERGGRGVGRGRGVFDESGLDEMF